MCSIAKREIMPHGMRRVEEVWNRLAFIHIIFCLRSLIEKKLRTQELQDTVIQGCRQWVLLQYPKDERMLSANSKLGKGERRSERVVGLQYAVVVEETSTEKGLKSSTVL